MSGSETEDAREAGDYCRSDSIDVVIRSVSGSRDIRVGGDCTIRQLKQTLSKHLGGPAEQPVLIHSGRVLQDTELMSHLKGPNGSVSLCMIQRPQPTHARPMDNPVSEVVKSELTADPDPDQNLIPTPTSPLCLVEGLHTLDLESNDVGFFPVLQREMESQLLGDPEMMRRLLRSSLVQNTISTSSPEIMRLLIRSNPQIQQLLQTNSEVEDMLNNTEVINQVLELISKPGTFDEMMQTLLLKQDDPPNTSAASDARPNTEATKPQSSLKTPQREMFPAVMTSSVNHPEQIIPTPAPSGDPTDPLKGLVAAPRAASGSHRLMAPGKQSLLEEIAASPDLMENLLSGPYVSSLLDCLSQNPDLAAQMLLSHPLFSGNVPLQQQVRHQIPLFLHQMQSPELLSVMLNPRAMEALLQIQQGLQTLAAEAPSLLPVAELGTSGASVEAAADAALNSQSGCKPQVATVTEKQQQQFVQQMLQTLANTNNQLRHEEEELEQEQLDSLGSRGRRANL